MRLGKRKDKEKDPSEVKSQGVDGITRLICLSKGQNPLKGNYAKEIFICNFYNYCTLIVVNIFLEFKDISISL